MFRHLRVVNIFFTFSALVLNSISFVCCSNQGIIKSLHSMQFAVRITVFSYFTSIYWIEITRNTLTLATSHIVRKFPKKNIWKRLAELFACHDILELKIYSFRHLLSISYGSKKLSLTSHSRITCRSLVPSDLFGHSEKRLH